MSCDILLMALGFLFSFGITVICGYYIMVKMNLI